MYPDTIPHNWIVVNQALGNLPVNYLWDWGDGSPNSTGTTPSHTYTTPGYYNICLSISDASGCSDAYCDSSTFLYKGDMSNTMITVNVITTNIAETVTLNNQITLYPNPVTDYFTVTCLNSDAVVTLYDLTGRILLKQHFNGKTIIDAGLLTNGIYIVEVKDEKGKCLKGKIIKH